MATDVDLPLTGGCGCGAVRFEVDAPPVSARLLPLHPLPAPHRHGGRRLGPRGAGLACASSSGEEHVRRWRPEGGLAKDFCGDCGSALFASDPESGEVAVVRFGAFDGDPGVRPDARQFVAYAAPWEPIPDDGLPRFPERRPS